jgi:membrane protease YdiL (CAAX protease family)
MIKHSATLLRAVVLLEITYIFLRTKLNNATNFHDLTPIQHELMWGVLRAASIVAVLIICWRYKSNPNFFTIPKFNQTTLVLVLLFVAQIFFQPKMHGHDLPLQLTYAATTIFVVVREELVYRYVIQNWLEGWLLPNERIFGSILLSSIVFTLYHLGAQPIASFPSIFLASLLLGAIYNSSGKSLTLVVACHFIDDVFIALY